MLDISTRHLSFQIQRQSMVVTLFGFAKPLWVPISLLLVTPAATRQQIGNIIATPQLHRNEVIAGERLAQYSAIHAPVPVPMVHAPLYPGGDDTLGLAMNGFDNAG